MMTSWKSLNSSIDSNNATFNWEIYLFLKAKGDTVGNKENNIKMIWVAFLFRIISELEGIEF